MQVRDEKTKYKKVIIPVVEILVLLNPYIVVDMLLALRFLRFMQPDNKKLGKEEYHNENRN